MLAVTHSGAPLHHQHQEGGVWLLGHRINDLQKTQWAVSLPTLLLPSGKLHQLHARSHTQMPARVWCAALTCTTHQDVLYAAVGYVCTCLLVCDLYAVLVEAAVKLAPANMRTRQVWLSLSGAVDKHHKAQA